MALFGTMEEALLCAALLVGLMIHYAGKAAKNVIKSDAPGHWLRGFFK